MRSRAPLVLALFALLPLSLAPTAGDIGGCGEAAEDLDPAKFWAVRYAVDCETCLSCQLATERCTAACQGPPADLAFPFACFPTVHDGEVCVRALDAAGCGEYAAYVADQGALVPSECDFCPSSKNPNTGGTGGTGGAPP